MTAGRTGVLTAVLCALAASASAQNLKAFPPGPKPLAVTISTYLIDFEKIDEQTLTHTIVAYLTMSWKDPRLVKGQNPQIDRETATLDQIWSPNMEFMNQHAPRETANSEILIADDGTVTYDERFKAELSTEFYLQHYPFDQQMLLMQVESFNYDNTEIVLVPRANRQLRSPNAFLPDWFVLDVNQRIDTDDENPDRKVYSRYTYDIHVKRKVGYYVWNVFLPLVFITLLAWGVFFVTPEDLQTRTGVSITALLTAIAFSLVISGTRPRVSYLTFMDAIFLNAYFLIFSTTASVIIAHFLIRRSGTTRSAEHLSGLGRKYFPLLMLVTTAALVMVFFMV